MNDVTDVVSLSGGDVLMLDDNVRVEVGLDRLIALKFSNHFAIREGGMTVGSGVVIEVVL